MTYTGMFFFILPAAVLVWGWRAYRRLRNHEEMLRLQKEERERNESACADGKGQNRSTPPC